MFLCDGQSGVTTSGDTGDTRKQSLLYLQVLEMGLPHAIQCHRDMPGFSQVVEDRSKGKA